MDRALGDDRDRPGWARGVWINLRAGLRLVTLRRVSPQDFHASLDQAVYLALLNLATSFVLSYLHHAPGASFNVFGVSYVVYGIAVYVLAAYVITRILRRPGALLSISIMLFSTLPWIGMVDVGIRRALALVSGERWVLYLSSAWAIAVIFRVMFLNSGRRVLRGGSIALLYFGLIWLAMACVPTMKMWVRAPGASYAPLDVEDVYYAQPRLLDRELDALKPQRPGIADLYFVGVGSYATQDVFMKEVRYARNLMDRRFDTRGRSVVLINNRDTVGSIPLASATNLRRTLLRMGKIMDPNEDILFLYITTHGAPGRLSMWFPWLRLNDLDAADLHRMLVASGIKWKVIVISACYSGSFIDALKDDGTLILTAAAANRTSFGCSDENDFTYFGEALLRDQLTHRYSLTDAFLAARREIGARERREGLTPSEPQWYEGPAIRARLRTLEARLGGPRPRHAVTR